MARGFESKAVTDQQETVGAVMPYSDRPTVDPARLAKQRKLELARADVVRRLGDARAEGHREILKRALAALDADIAELR